MFKKQGRSLFLHSLICLQSIKGATWATDIYGLGTVLYELVEGDPPFYSNDIVILQENMKRGKIEYPNGLNPITKDLLMVGISPYKLCFTMNV